MSAFYFPITSIVQGIPVIIYPMIGLETVVQRESSKSLEEHLESLYSSNSNFLKTGQYHIIILWHDNRNIMTDVWIFGEFESWIAGPTVDVKNFKGMTLVTDMGVTAEDGLIMLGREGEMRRQSKSIDEFINGKRPKLPEDIAPIAEFYN